MKNEFKVIKNFNEGKKFYSKPDAQKSKERVTFVLSKTGKEFLNAYCDKSEMTLSDVIRTALQDYFEKVGFRYESVNEEDKRQLRMFNEV